MGGENLILLRFATIFLFDVYFISRSSLLERLRVGDSSGTETENGKGSDADADVHLKKSSTKVVDVKEVMRVDSILAGIMRKVMNL